MVSFDFQINCMRLHIVPAWNVLKISVTSMGVDYIYIDTALAVEVLL